MLAAALHDGTAHRRTTFEVFARRLPEGRRYGVVAGTARFVEALAQFRFDDAALASLEDFLDRDTLAYLADYRFSGDVDGYAEGELYFPGSPVLSVHGTFGECVVLETLALSILNHDTAIASAAARMVSAAEERPLIEMGSRRTHEQAAVAAARAAYIAGFTGSSNLEAQRRYGVPALGTSAHAFTLLHTSRTGARRASRVQGTGRRAGRRHHAARRHLRHHRRASPTPSRWQAPSSARSASTPATSACWPARSATNSTALARTKTRIVVSGDLDEFAIAALRAEPVDIYGVGTSVVTGSGAPTASMVYKLVEVDGMPVEKRSSHKESHGGRKQALRLAKPSGTIVEEIVHPFGQPPPDRARRRALTVDAGARGRTRRGPQPRRGPRRVKDGLHSLPWDGLKLSKGEPAIPTRMIAPASRRRLGEATGETAEVTELLAKAVAALGGSERERPDRDGRGGRARLRHRRAPRRAGRHRDRQVAGVPGACDRAGRRHRRARCGVDGDHRPAAPARRPRPAAARRLTRRRAAPPTGVRTAEGARKLPVPQQDSQRLGDRTGGPAAGGAVRADGRLRAGARRAAADRMVVDHRHRRP